MVCIYRLENSLNNEDFDLSAHKKINFLIELRIERCYLFLNRLIYISPITFKAIGNIQVNERAYKDVPKLQLSV